MKGGEILEESNEKAYEFNSRLEVGWSMPRDYIYESSYDEKQIQEYIRNPYEHQEELRSLSWWAYRINGDVCSAVEYLRTMHTLDKVCVCKSRNILGKKPRSYARNKLKMLSTLDTIKYKQRIRDALLKRCNDGIYYYYFEVNRANAFQNKIMTDIEIQDIVDINELGVKASIISLPVDWCKIIGKKDNSFLIAFNLSYFNQFTPTERQRKLLTFPKEIRNGWEKHKDTLGINAWLVLDNSHTIVDKSKTPDNSPYGIPLAICALDDILYSNYFTESKRTVLDEINSQVIYEVFPEGERKGTCSLTGKQQTDQHNTVKNAVVNKNNKNGVAFFSLASGTKLEQIKTDTSLLDEKNQKAIANSIPKDLGISSASLNGEATGNYATATLNVEMVAANVYSWIENFMSELNKCINANIIRDKHCIVDCTVLPTTYVNRDKFFNNMKTLYAECGGSFQAVIAASGMDVESYLSMLDEEKELKFDIKYQPHQSMYTQSNKDSGRPENENPTNENTVQSKSNNSNANKKPQ